MIRNVKAAKASGLTLYKEAIRSIHPLCSSRSTQPCLLMLRHGEMTKVCHFWLQILDFYKWKPGLLKSLINGSTANSRT